MSPRSKAEAFVNVLKSRTLEWIYEGVEYKICNAKMRGDALQIIVVARKDRKPIKLNNPYVFVNPPVNDDLENLIKQIVQNIAGRKIK